MDTDPGAIEVPLAKIVMHGLRGQQVLRQPTPDIARAQAGENGIENILQLDSPWVATGLRQREKGSKEG